MSVAWITLRCSSARVSASRSNSRMRDHRPTYIDGAYCAWMALIVLSVGAIEPVDGSSRRWRASTAQWSSRVLRTRSATP